MGYQQIVEHFVRKAYHIQIVLDIIKIIVEFVKVEPDYFFKTVECGISKLSDYVELSKTSVRNMNKFLKFKDPFGNLEPVISPDPTIQIRCKHTFKLTKRMHREYIFEISNENMCFGFGIRSVESLYFELPSLAATGPTTARADRFIFYSDGTIDVRRKIKNKFKNKLMMKLQKFRVRYCRMVISTNNTRQLIIWYVRNNEKEIEAWKFRIYKECVQKQFCVIVSVPKGPLIKLVSNIIL